MEAAHREQDRARDLLARHVGSERRIADDAAVDDQDVDAGQLQPLLEEGVLAPGRPADLAICGPVEGSAGSTLSDALAHGDLPGISYVLIDGEVVVAGRSRQTPPSRIRPIYFCCTSGQPAGK